MDGRVVELAGAGRAVLGGGLAHLLLVDQVGYVRRSRVAPVLVNYHDVLEVEELVDDSAHPAPEAGLGNEDLGGRHCHTVLYLLRAQVGGEESSDRAGLERAEVREVELRYPVEVYEDRVAPHDAEAVEHVGEPVREGLDLTEGVPLDLAAPPDPHKRGPVSQTTPGMAVDDLVGGVQPPAGQPRHAVVLLVPWGVGQRIGGALVYSHDAAHYKGGPPSSPSTGSSASSGQALTFSRHERRDCLLPSP